MSIDFAFRLAGMVLFAVAGWFGGNAFAPLVKLDPLYISVTLGLIGALAGLVLTPYLTLRPAQWIRARVSELPISVLLMGMIGLIVGLIVAGLISFPLSLLPEPFNGILPFAGALLFSWLGIQIFVMRQKDIISLFRNLRPGARQAAAEAAREQAGGELHRPQVLLDTSVIIDGRIADIAKTGFIAGTIVVPKFVLSELQHIADSSDGLRRNRGRRGLEVLNQLQRDAAVPVEFTDQDLPMVREVDDKLVALAKQLRCPVATNDYNLNHVASLQGVRVLNINELANAIKVVFLPGETLSVTVIQEGKEQGQGVAYLDDGTMVVVDDGRRHIGRDLNVVVTKIFQTQAGRMIFARPETNAGAPSPKSSAH